MKKTAVRKKAPRRKTMRGGYKTAAEACADIAASKSVADAKKIYRKASLKFHPDKGGDAEEFKKLGDCMEEFETSKVAPPPAAAQSRPAQGGPPSPPQAKPAPKPKPREDPDIHIPYTFIPMGTNISEIDPEVVDAMNAEYSMHPESLHQAILNFASLFVAVLPKGARERDMLRFFQQAKIPEENYDAVLDSIQALYPDIAFPLKEDYPIVFFLQPEDVPN